MTTKDLMAELERIAVERYDGHFTVMRFTTNWRVCFRTPDTDPYEGEVEGMAVGKTFEEAAMAAIEYEAVNPRGWRKRLLDAKEALIQSFVRMGERDEVATAQAKKDLDAWSEKYTLRGAQRAANARKILRKLKEEGL